MPITTGFACKRDVATPKRRPEIFARPKKPKDTIDRGIRAARGAAMDRLESAQKSESPTVDAATVLKTNPYHDQSGRFSSKDNDADGSPSGSGAGPPEVKSLGGGSKKDVAQAYQQTIKPELGGIAKGLGMSVGVYTHYYAPTTKLVGGKDSDLQHAFLTWGRNESGGLKVTAKVMTKAGAVERESQINNSIWKPDFARMLAPNSEGEGVSSPTAKTLKEKVTSAIDNARSNLRNDYKAKKMEALTSRSELGVKKLKGMQKVPMDLTAISAAMDAANS